MTFWDFLCEFIEKGGLAWTLLVIALGGVFQLIAHPQVVKEWNVQITMWIAAIAPKKRKSAFEKRLNLTIDSVKTKFDESAPPLMKKFLPYDLKVEWVDENETPESFFDNNQVVVYVHSYKDESQQVIGILHSYCSKGFAQKPKIYMPSSVSKSSDMIITQKLAQYAGHNIYDYFNREYIPELLKKDRTFVAVFEKLRKIDTDGLFLPVLLNEIDKYANRIYPSVPSQEIMNPIIHLMDFIYNIVARAPGDLVPLTFCENEIKVRIILAVSDFSYCIDKPVQDAEATIKNRSVNTIYVLATGSKMNFAKDIADAIYKRNPQDVFEPIETNYKRYTKTPSGADSICFEINLR